MCASLLDVLLPSVQEHIQADAGLRAAMAYGRELGVNSSSLIADTESALALLQERKGAVLEW